MACLGETLLWLSQNVSRQLLDMRDFDGRTAEEYAKHKGVKREILKGIRPWDPMTCKREDATSRCTRSAAYRQPQRVKKENAAKVEDYDYEYEDDEDDED